jgi:hypothetical protein
VRRNGTASPGSNRYAAAGFGTASARSSSDGSSGNTETFERYSTIQLAAEHAAPAGTQLIDAVQFGTRVSSAASGSATVVDAQNPALVCGARIAACASARVEHTEIVGHDRRGLATAVVEAMRARGIGDCATASHDATVVDFSRTHRLVGLVEERVIAEMPTITVVITLISHVVMCGRRFAGRQRSRVMNTEA